MATEEHQSHQDATSTPPRPPRNLRTIALVAVAAAIVIALFGILQRRSHEEEVKQWTQEQAIPTVAVISPQQGPAVQHLVLPGTVQAWYEAPIFARVSGYLKNWYFDYGAHVKKGDLLAEIDAPDLDAQLAASQAKLNSARATVKVREAEKTFAETTFERWRDSPKGVVSEQEQQSKQADYNSAAARVNAATAEVAADQGDVDRLQALEDYKRITAPFDGVVTARETDIGALINAGSGTGGGNGQRHRLEVAPHPDEVLDSVTVAHAHDVLFDDRPLVEVGRGVVGGHADDLHPAFVGLVVGPGSDVGGE